MPLRGERQDRPTYEVVGHFPKGKGKIIVANHKIFGRQCVQKMVDLHGATGDIAFLEPRLMKSISHPNITPVDEVQWDPQRDDCITFVMPFYEGGSVEQALELGTAFSIGDVISLASQTLDALAYLHVEARVIHRDVKPGNVFLDDPPKRAYLGDLGSAARIESDGRVPTVKMTTVYQPPEAMIAKRVGPEADVYSMGVTIYEMLNGLLPYAQLDNLMATVRLATGKRPVPDAWLDKWPPHIPDRLRRVVRKAMREDPALRHRSARALIADLTRFEYIDWKRVSGSGLLGTWEGAGPSSVATDRRTDFQITSRILQAGSDKGRLRIAASYRRPGGTWRTLLPDVTVKAPDASSVTQYFAAAVERASQRFAAR